MMWHGLRQTAHIDRQIDRNRFTMMIFLRLVTVIATCFALFGNIALAQLRIDITEGQVAPTPIAIANFTGPDAMTVLLEEKMVPAVNAHFGTALAKRETPESVYPSLS